MGREGGRGIVGRREYREDGNIGEEMEMGEEEEDEFLISTASSCRKDGDLVDASGRDQGDL